MATIRFQEVKLKATKRWRENGKQRQETKVFMQTINPFNKDADGMPKTREQILAELYHERAEWLGNETPRTRAEIEKESA